MVPRPAGASRAPTAVHSAALLAGTALLAGGAGPAAGQPTPDGAPEGRLAGTVVDAGTGAPLAGAAVRLRRLPAGDGRNAGSARKGGEAGPARASGPGGGPTPDRTVLTDASGAYRFTGLPAGRYRLRVSRLGYRPATLEVRVGPAAGSSVSVGLSVRPVALEPVAAEAGAARPFARDRGRGEAIEVGRRRSVRARRARFLDTGVRSVTHDQVVESVTLGETDLFRALKRLPGVSTDGDFSSRPWVRGATWGRTRTYFDGLPLFSPVHGGGGVSSFNPDAVGSLFLFPGVRPPRLGGGGSAVIDVGSRPAGTADELTGYGELSLASARLTLDRGFADGRGSVLLGVRRSYADWLLDAVGAGDDDRDATVLPYALFDLTGRLSYRLDGETQLTVSGLWEKDDLYGDMPDVLQGGRADWGNTAARATVSTAAGELWMRHTVGVSRYRVDLRKAPPDPDLEFNAPDLPAVDHALTHLTVRGRVEPAGAEDAAWSAGWDLVRESVSYAGPPPDPYPFDLVPERGRTSFGGALHRAGLWGDYRWRPAEGLKLRTGLRVDVGEPVRGAGPVRIAPRVRGRLEVTDDLALSAGVGRHWEYVQPLAPAARRITAELAAGQVWTVAGSERAPLRSDIATVGAEYWLGDDWLASADAYLRRSTGGLRPDPRPEVLRPPVDFVPAETTARGAELSIRKIAGRLTASAAYSYGVAEAEAAGFSFPASGDRRHALDATAMWRPGSSFRLGAAFSAGSGLPFTRVFPPVERFFVDGRRLRSEVLRPALRGPPNAGRAPGYSSLDLLVDWRTDFGTWSLGVYLQVRNALGADNDRAYVASEDCRRSPFDNACDLPGAPVHDDFGESFPRMPLLGFRVAF